MSRSNSIPVEAPGSFRDPSGRVYLAGDVVFRSIQKSYAPHWRHVSESGFAKRAVDSGLLHAFTEVPPLSGSWKSLQSAALPFISYPYEWCFSQLKDAALHTLELMRLALEYDLILKDATAYNIQFTGNRPIFIDHLSFEIRDKTKPWPAYLQFCKHFLAPLALMCHRSPDCGFFLTNWIDGLPLELVVKLLPLSSKLSPMLYIHLYAHAKMQKKYNDPRRSLEKLHSLSLSEKTLPHLCESLAHCINTMRLRSQKTEWSDYYEDTNYSQAATQAKALFVKNVAAAYPGTLAVDVGANTGFFSRILAEHFTHVLAADMDHLAVEKMYRSLKSDACPRILPFVQNLFNPSPAIGWATQERLSFTERCDADLLCALALIHHLALGAGIPFDKIASFFWSLLKNDGILLLEFVPLEDSQVQRMLAARQILHAEYSIDKCIQDFSPYFDCIQVEKICESHRNLIVMRKKEQ